jgi:hypothetical protein
MEQTQTASEAILRLEEPFASKEVKWIVKATSRDGRKGRVVPYADPRAYKDRLNQIFTASGWTRQYTVHTVSPITRVKKDKEIQTGKVMVTCVVSITGFGSHAGSGEEWADDENAMTSAEAQAFSAHARALAWGATSTTSVRCGWKSTNTSGPEDFRIYLPGLCLQPSARAWNRVRPLKGIKGPVPQCRKVRLMQP